jgi:clan AA aspartic protease (TIGR02281 family)
MKSLLKSLAIATMLIAPQVASGMELTCSGPIVYVGQQSRDAHDTVVGVDVYYANGEWQVRHRMGNGSEVNRVNQYAMRDTSNQNMAQWRGESYKYPGILWMVGELQRDKRTSQPVYVEWLYNRGRLAMNAAAYCKEQVVARRPEPQYVPQPAPQPAAPPAPPPPVATPAPQQQPQPLIIVVPQPAPPPPVVVHPEPKPEPKTESKSEPKPAAKRDSIPVNIQNNSVMLNVGVGNQTVTMLLDTGATNSVVTQAVADLLVRSGHARWAGEEKYSLADGSVKTAQTIVINEVSVGSHVVRNVKASVTANRTDMLLGFSVLKAIGPFMIDTRTNELIFVTTEAAL